MDTVALHIRLSQLVFRYWRVPLPESQALVSAVLTSRFARPGQLCEDLALLDECAAAGDVLFATVITPRFIMDLLRDLVLEVRLTPRQSRVIEAAVLRAVDRDGKWKAV